MKIATTLIASALLLATTTAQARIRNLHLTEHRCITDDYQSGLIAEYEDDYGRTHEVCVETQADDPYSSTDFGSTPIRTTSEAWEYEQQRQGVDIDASIQRLMRRAEEATP